MELVKSDYLMKFRQRNNSMVLSVNYLPTCSWQILQGLGRISHVGLQGDVERKTAKKWRGYVADAVTEH